MSRIREELRRNFDLASLRHEGAKTLSAKEWQDFRAIKKHHDQTRRLIARSYEIDYPSLLATAKRRLINEAGNKTLEFKHRFFGADKFDKGQLHRRAHNRVVDARRRDLGDVDRREAADLRRLMDRSDARQSLKEKPQRDFQKATNRRSGAERRHKITRER